MIYETIKAEHKRLSAKLEFLVKQLPTFPDDDLLCARNGRRSKWYKSNGCKPVYIPKQDRAFAEKLALKKYYTLQISELSQEVQILERCLKQYKKLKHRSQTLLEDDSPYKELLTPHFKSFSDEVKRWSSEVYVPNPMHPEHLIHSTISGQKVRSKSEVIIANALFTSKIPYRYECPLQIDKELYYPDFTILHTKTGKIIYWEHFGLMDNPSYRESSYHKLKMYGNQNIIPDINLITTYETSSHPIDSANVNHIIEQYFL